MLLYIILPLALSFYVSWRFKSKIAEYSQVRLRNNLSGAEVAERMLKENGIYDVKVISAEGQLTDHYNPLEKTVNLSHDVYYGQNVMAAAIAAHECGHAVQHSRLYGPLQFRSAIVPAVSIASSWVQWVLLAGILLLQVSPIGKTILLVGILLFAMITLFSFITLPVEFDASRRALAWLNEKRIIDDDEAPMAKSALSWAAMTYVVAALASLATLLYYIQIFNSRRD